MDDFKVVREALTLPAFNNPVVRKLHMDAALAALDRIEARLKAAEAAAAAYKADRDDYDAVLGRRMAERDKARADAERLAAAGNEIAERLLMFESGHCWVPAWQEFDAPAIARWRAALAAHEEER